MFADQFVSLFTICPKNTILIYSYSKYFGATGWRLGIIGIHHDNIFDAQIKALPVEKQKEIDERYQSIKIESDPLKFIDRLVGDSRLVTLKHNAGLSTPQQVQMVLFSLFALMDTSGSYKATIKQFILERKRALYHAIGSNLRDDENNVNTVGYFTVLDLDWLCERIHSRRVADWLQHPVMINRFLLRMAREKHVVLMSTHAFGVQRPSVRVCLANRNQDDYKQIGQAILALIEECFKQFKACKIP